MPIQVGISNPKFVSFKGNICVICLLFSDCYLFATAAQQPKPFYFIEIRVSEIVYLSLLLSLSFGQNDTQCDVTNENNE